MKRNSVSDHRRQAPPESFDSTERVAKAPQQSREAIRDFRYFQAIIDRSPAVVFLRRNAQGWPIEYVSKNVRQFGYTEEDFLSGRVSWVAITHPDDVPRLEAELEQYEREGIHEFIQEYRLFNRSGDVRWIEDRTKAILDLRGTVTHYQGIILDITERKTAEEELARQQESLEELIEQRTGRLKSINDHLRKEIQERRETEHRLRQSERFLDHIFSSIQDGISILDHEMNIVRVNPAMEFWYVHALPLAGRKCYDAYHGRGKPCEPCPTLKTLQTGNVSIGVVPRIGVDGAVTGWLELYAFPLLDQDTQKIQGAIEYVRDITERRKAEEELRQRETTIRALLNATQDGMLLMDPRGKTFAR